MEGKKKKLPIGIDNFEKLQMEDKEYEEQFLDEGMDSILKYGIAFYKKRCRVILDNR